MTEFSTNNDNCNKSHLSQPLQNSPNRHYPNNHNFHQQHKYHLTNTSPQHFANINNTQHLHQQHLQQQTHNNKNNQQTLPFNSTANINGSNINATQATVASSSPTSATHSPLHYKNPLNSPNNSPFAYAYHQNTLRGAATTAAQQQQYYLQRGNKLPLLTQTQYQKHLNDLLLQQQHLQQQQQQLLSAKANDSSAADDELSEESLKQNVAIVLNNLDRYNNALRSIILNEQVSSNSSIFCDDSLFIDYDGDAGGGGNNNFLLNNSTNSYNKMATAATPESDYNSNATTPGSRSNHLQTLDSNLMQQQQQQHMVGYTTATATAAAAVGGGGGCGINGLVNNGGGGVGYSTFGSNNINCSLASSHDFTHDNSDYQWFLDYGYRDGSGGMQRSVLSSLSASYNAMGDLIYYEDLAKNLDANLAEVDMESFRAEDIHSLLSYCKSLGCGNSRLQQSLLMQHNMLPMTGTGVTPINGCQHAHNMSQTSTTSTSELIDNSFCKSELLFSPVKESHISVDSLDMDAYPDDGDIILTCKANKDNYTIAFEGSVLYSDESFYEPNEIAMKNKHNYINLHNNLEDIVKRKALEVSMSRSEQVIQPLCNLQKSNSNQLQRYPSGNNNTTDTITITRHLPHCSVRKSNSLPNLNDSNDEVMTCSHPSNQDQLQIQQSPQHRQQQLNVSQAVTTSTMESCKTRNLLPMCQMPISTSVSISERLESESQQLITQHRHKHRCCCSNNVVNANGVPISAAHSHNFCSSSTAQQQHQIQKQHSSHISGSASSGNSNPPAFNLVKLFIKQKSSNCSTEDAQGVSAHTCMDVSSGCWPSSDAAGSSSSSAGSLEQRLRKKSMNDSGKGSALSRHDEEEDPMRGPEFIEEHSTLKKQMMLRARNDTVFYNQELDGSTSSGSSLTATNSPAHRRRSMPLRNPQLHHLTANAATSSLQSSDASRSNSEQLTQVYLSSGTSGGVGDMERKQRSRRIDVSRPVSHASSSEMITRSMQTSCGSLSTRSSLSERYRCVPPSFLAKLNKLGEENQAPIYVIYPNYALPDLGFVKTSASPDVIFSPFNYKMTMGSGDTDAMTSSSLKKRFSLSGNDDEILKTMDYKHISDWQSLATLLPVEYRRRLKHIPEVNSINHTLEAELSQRPLFCLTPPIRRNRPHICDCAKYFQQQQQQPQTHIEEGGGSSSSGSSQQPSSGYRGSSTLLTDSELDNTDPLKQMYVYQYEQQRMDSGVETSPAVATKPQPMPRGILRKSSSAQSRTNRNSMIEGQQAKLSKLEKRRSLQEPPYNYAVGSAEELTEVFEEETDDLYAVPQPRKERLSRKDLDARARAENFLASLPRSELKYYAEIAAILESSGELVQYDAAALKKEVSRVLSQQKKVSFNDVDHTLDAVKQQQQQQLILQAEQRHKRFSTPPNSPNISMANGGSSPGLRMNSGVCPATVPRRATLDELEQRKIESNRFKRLQIQWELMSTDSSMLKDLANQQATKSGGSTPTSATAHKSRIPRPVSYPAGKRTDDVVKNGTTPKKSIQTSKQITKHTIVSPQIIRISGEEAVNGKTTRSPSRIVPPKRYSIATPITTTPAALVTSPSTPAAVPTRARTPTSRGAVTAPNTPKRRVQSPRTIPRVR